MVFESSRYLMTDEYSRLDRESTPLLTLRMRHDWNPDIATNYQMIAGDTLDGLAYKYYGDTTLRWVIMDANPQYRSEFDIEVGEYIIIPDFDEVWDYVNTLNGGNGE